MPQPVVAGDLPKLIANQEGLYEGDLIFYFRVLFFHASNLTNPYHNFRHMSHVLWLCYQACRYYRNELSPRQMRVLLIAALFHDFDHPGQPHPGEEDPDHINIELAVAGLRRHLQAEDRVLLRDIEETIRATHFPYKTTGDKLDLLGRIIRDADLAQALAPAWIQQVVIGLSREWEMQPVDVLKLQSRFLSGIAFNTDWAREMFPPELIREKMDEAETLLRFLGAEPAIAA
jgi:hypothetical protein